MPQLKQNVVTDSYDQPLIHLSNTLHVYPDFDFLFCKNGVVIGIDSEQVCIYKNADDHENLRPAKCITWEELNDIIC